MWGMDPLFTAEAPRRTSRLNVRIVLIVVIILAAIGGAIAAWHYGYLPLGGSKTLPGELTIMTPDPWNPNGERNFIGVLKYTPSLNAVSQLLPQKQNDTVINARMAPGGDMLAAVITNRGTQRVSVLSLSDLKAFDVWIGTSTHAGALAWSSNGYRLAFAQYFQAFKVGADGERVTIPDIARLDSREGVIFPPPALMIADRGEWKPRRISEGSPALLSPDGARVLSMLNLDTAVLIDSRATPALVSPVEFPGQPLNNSAVSPTGDYAAVWVTGAIAIVRTDWVSSSFTEIGRFPTTAVNSMVFNENNDLLVLGRDGVLRFYTDITNEKPKLKGKYRIDLPQRATLLNWNMP